jgi:hypothetical protein
MVALVLTEDELEMVVHVEVLMAAWAEGIRLRRRGLEVNGAGSGFRKQRSTDAQLLAMVARLGTHQSGPTMGRHL